jgi:twitching motility protein PilU
MSHNKSKCLLYLEYVYKLDHSMSILSSYLKFLVEQEGSDLYLTTGAPPSIKVHGRMQAIVEEKLKLDESKKIAYELMSAKQKVEFEESPEMNLAISESGLGRFRVNIFQQRGQVGLVIRHIKTDIPTPESLGVPDILKDVIMQKRGLILFVGATGSGKSTSMAALINFRNQNDAGHIITIEDPIEYVHNHQQSIVNQREVGIDTARYQDALKNALRQAPDVIQIGEIRAAETMDHGIAFAETGHLCISTLHANNANQALDRIINFFPEEKHNQVFLDLSLNLRAIISQRLIPSTDGKRALAMEILLNTPLVADLIKRGDVHEIKDIMKRSEKVGMQTFDTALFKLYQEGKISEEEAVKNADSQNNVKLQISLGKGISEDDGDGGLSIEEDEDDNTFFTRKSTDK